MAANPEKFSLVGKSKAWHSRRAEYTRNWRALNLETMRRLRRKYEYKRYGLTEEGIGIIEEFLGQVPCEKCKKSLAVTVDHCHKTNTFRGLLCRKCNAGIGLLGDDLQGIEDAVSYLRRAA